MNIKRIELLIAILIMSLFFGGNSVAQQAAKIVPIARLVIDPAQLENYKVALKEHAETAIRAEPGVLMLYAVYEKANPTHVTVFEIYANNEAYQSHILSQHFLKYKHTTKDMVKSLELMDVTPIALERKL